jgi:IMP dehydrogenase/GMP reductase
MPRRSGETTQEGGIGIIHKNMFIDNRARQVDRVKKFESGVISDPITVSPDMTIRHSIPIPTASSGNDVPPASGRAPATNDRSYLLRKGSNFA